MKLFLIAFAVIAAVAADVSHLPTNEYLPPVQEAAPVQVIVEEAPVQQAPVEAAPAHELADDGYRYKTQRRVVYRRNRRDASHVPTNDYLPPVHDSETEATPTNDYLPPVYGSQTEAAPAHEVAADGYRYKTNRRVVYRRNRRDASHVVSNEYLPPVQESAPVQVIVEEAPVQQAPVEAAPAHELADDGYRYKTQRRVVYRRNRRDASHVPTNDYLPPVHDSETEATPTNDYLPPVYGSQTEAAPAHEVAADGYRYKTNRRVVYRRNRRDASHVVSNEYLPPVQESAPVQVIVEEAPVQQAPVEAAPAHELADDGYRYKTQRRVVYRRNRRDASHVPTNDYLPPVHESQTEATPANDYLPPVYESQTEAAPAHEVAADGYRYKTNRRVVYRRNRRDASHVPTNDYLPPVQESAPVQAPFNDYLPPVEQVEAAPAHEVAADGYRYKTNRRVVYRRNRRDASHVPTNDYLPPVQESAPVQVPTNDYLPPVEQVEAAPAHEVAADGYRYKTQRRVVYRRNRRDASHVVSNEYLPPVQEAAPVQIIVEEAPVQEAPVEAAPAHELASDGYRYKTHRRVVYRRH